MSKWSAFFYFLLILLSTSAFDSTTAQPLPYVVDGLALGGKVRFDSQAYRAYHCTPSNKFPDFTWCHKEKAETANRGACSSNSILHDQDGTTVYVNCYIEPAFFGANDLRAEIDRLSAKFREPAREFRMPRREGLPDAIIAVWGKIELEELSAADVSIVASGGSIKGLLVSFLGDLQRSAKAGVPVYQLAGGAGFLWAATFDQDGQGVLRFLTIDASQMAPPNVAQNPQSAPSQASPLTQSPLQDGQAAYDAYDRGEYATALRLWAPPAAQGNAVAQHNLGWMYLNGLGVPKDDKQAVKWYRLAAEQGDAWAQNYLGVAYENGEGVTKDDKEAIKWYRLAAEQGEAYAQHNLGWMYQNGQGVPKDDREAIKWYRLAAEQGQLSAQLKLGDIYKEGRGIAKDDKESVKWYRLAGEQGNIYAQVNVAMAYENGRGVSQDYNEAVKWYRLAADKGDGSAENNLGSIYENGRGVTKDHSEAIKWYRLAAEHGDASAQNNLGSIYEYGRGVPKDYEEAIKWYRLGAEQGNAFAQNKLGMAYENGQGVPKDYDEAIKWYRGAADRGNAAAQSRLRWMYENGEGVRTLMRMGKLKESDYLGAKTYVLADGSTFPAQTFRIRSLKVGNKVLENVNGSIASVKGGLLLGQSFLSRFKSWSVDNTKHALLLSE
jgi:TPR repeat protein